jgi:hypothetical protein
VRMRRLSLILLAALAVLPAAALAARKAPGDGVFELRAVNGVVILTGKGVLWGQIDHGSMRVTDPDLADGQQLFVSGADRTKLVDGSTTLYSGTDIHFRTTGGKYKIRFKGTGIDLSAIGVGGADMTGDPNAVDTGDYAVDGGKWIPVPLNETVRTFGVQPPVTAPPTSP